MLEDLTQRGLLINGADFDQLNRRVERAQQRGIHLETDQYRGPYVRVEAAGDLPYFCFGPVLRALERGTFFDVTLRLLGDRDRPAFVTMLAERRGRYSTILRPATGGRIAWNGETIDLDGLRQRVRGVGGDLQNVVVAPAADADFATVYETMRGLRQLQEPDREEADVWPGAK